VEDRERDPTRRPDAIRRPQPGEVRPQPRSVEGARRGRIVARMVEVLALELLLKLVREQIKQQARG
jgi:hypothetical protein